MADEEQGLRTIPIHKSLHRPELVMGGEREPVLCINLMSGIAIIYGVVHLEIILLSLSLILYIGSMMLFRRMAKIDPQMTKVWQRFVTYQTYYPGRTSVWCQKTYRS